MNARSAEGRRRAKLQVELQPRGVPFDGTISAESIDWVDTGIDGVELSLAVTGLLPGDTGHWRVRAAWDPSQNPRQRYGRWQYGDPRSPEGNHLRGWPDSDFDLVPDDEDCGPADPAVFPGADELCDGVDSDCDGSLVDGFDNLDGDSEPDCIDADDDGDGSLDVDDCGPFDAAVHPAANEVCDAIDDDCDGSLLGTCDVLDPDCDGSLVGTFADLDSDGDPDCIDADDDGDGYVDLLLGGDDCDDQHQGIHPAAVELCDATDWNCDGDAETGLNEDVDGDGFSSLASCSNNTDCDDYDADINIAAPEVCDGIDQDCDLEVDEGFDVDGDGVSTCQGDCDDNNLAVFPGATEGCNGVDDDCDTDIDEGFDVDGDGERTCDGDCDDSNAAVPGSAASAA